MSENSTRLPSGRRLATKIDPIALLKREHEIILDQLCSIDGMIGPGPEEVSLAAGRLLAGPARTDLQELLGFFADRVEVHFEREEILIEALARKLRSKQDKRERLEEVIREHRFLQAEATRIVHLLGNSHGESAPSGEADLAPIRSFVRHFGWHLCWEEHRLFALAEARLTTNQKCQVGCRMLQV